MAQQPWVKNPIGTWVKQTPMVRSATGWRYSSKIYQKTAASTWTLRWTREIVPPAAPTIESVMANAAIGTVTVDIGAPADADVSHLIIKFSKLAYPSSILVDADYNATIASDGYAWSKRPVTSNELVTRVVTGMLPAEYYYISVWAVDDKQNVSARAITMARFPDRAQISATPESVAYLNSVASRSYFAVTNGGWSQIDNHLVQGGGYAESAWWYGEGIRSRVQNGTISDMKIYIQRVNTVHGLPTAYVTLRAHSMLSQPAGDPGSLFSPEYATTSLGTLNRGEGKWFTIPADWWPAFIDGSLLGVGFLMGMTTADSPYYMYTYGAGTNSGQIYIKYIPEK